MIQLPAPLKRTLDALRKQGYTVSGYIRMLVERDVKTRKLILAFMLPFLLASPAWATPTVTWDGPWQVDQDFNHLNIFSFDGFVGNSIAPFITDPSHGTSASDNPTVSILWGTGGGQQGGHNYVSASRQVTLTGSPNGWTETLSLHLTGTMTASRWCLPVLQGGTCSEGSSVVSASLLPLTVSQSASAVNVVQVPLDLTDHFSTVLQDGAYSLSLALRGGGQGASGGSALLSTEIAFTPIHMPEPATWLLLLTGVALVIAWRHRLGIAKG